MAEDLNSIVSSYNVTGTLGAVGDVLLWAFIVLAVLGIVYLIYYLMSFKNTLVIRDTINQRKIISTRKWKEKRDKNNNIWLITPFNRIKKPLPPAKAIEISIKGRKFVEAWRGEDTETFIWIEDDFDYETFKESNPEFQPLTTQERELLINEISKSHAHKKRSLFDTIIQVSLIMAPIILIAVIGLVLGDITEGLNTFSKPLTNAMETTSQAFVTASENLAGIQTLDELPLEAPN